MTLAEKLTAIDTGLKSVLNNCNTELAAKGTSEVASLFDVPEAIRNIERIYDGEPEKPYIDTRMITDWSRYFMLGIRQELLPLIDTSGGTDFSYMFYEGYGKITTVPSLDTSKGTNFNSMFRNCTALNIIPELDTSSGTDFGHMFQGCTALTSIPRLDTSKGTNFYQTFYNCTALTSIPELDTSNVLTFNQAFYECQALTAIPPLDMRNASSLSGNYKMFYNCKNLQSLTLIIGSYAPDRDSFYGCTKLENLTIGNGCECSLNLTYATALTQESLHGIIENLADLTGLDACSFTVGSTNLAKIDAEHIAMLEAKNWSYS